MSGHVVTLRRRSLLGRLLRAPLTFWRALRLGRSVGPLPAALRVAWGLMVLQVRGPGAPRRGR